MAANSADVIFNQADLNKDQRLDLNEFRQLLAANLGTSQSAGGASYGGSSYGASADISGIGATGGYSSSYESSTGAAFGGDLSYGGASYGTGAGYGAGYGAGGYGATGSYGVTGGYGDAGYGSSSYGSSYNSSVGNLAGGVTDLSAVNYSGASQTTAVQQYETDAQGLFRDSNPQIIRRPAPGGNLTYTQNIRVRFLQPPPVPPPGPLIIKEVRPPQPPLPPPLRIRQQAPPLPQPPPLVLRERPPNPPASVASQTVIRRLAALPVPPRSVIIERIPPAPPRPRDIIIERWIPYAAQAKRRTIVQRAGAAQQYARPRNVIIQYEAPQVRIVRQFQRLGISQENPAVYVQRYGGTLLESQSLVQQARAAGVIEDISPPLVGGGFGVGSGQFASSSGSLGYDAAGVVGGAAGFESGFGGGSSYESSYSSSSDVSGLGIGYGSAVYGGSGYGGAGYGSAGFGGSSYGATDFGSAGLAGASSYESTSYGSSVGTLGGSSNAAFSAADTNQDGVLSQSEFQAAGY